MSLMIEKAKRLMRRKFVSMPNLIEHTEKVTQKALEIGKRLRGKGFDVDMELLEMGGYLHDIGRSVSHGIDHGVESGRMLRQLGFSDSIVNLVERHVGAGITVDEAERLGLPKRDFIPETLEEKILAYADKFLESELVFKTVNGEQVVERRNIQYDSIEPTLRRFKKLFGSDSSVVLRLEKLRYEMEGLLK